MKPLLFGEREGWMFSNFPYFRTYWRGQWWDTSEHIYQAEKFLDPHIREAIRQAFSAHDAKKLAQANQSSYRPDWYCVRDETMLNVLRAKAGQHMYVAQKLEETGTRILVENAPWDEYWGNGRNGNGFNMLGQLWMVVRQMRRIQHK